MSKVWCDALFTACVNETAAARRKYHHLYCERLKTLAITRRWPRILERVNLSLPQERHYFEKMTMRCQQLLRGKRRATLKLKSQITTSGQSREQSNI